METFQKGFSFIEVLVSLFILSVGLLAIVGLSITALRTTQQSYLQSQISLQMAAIAERLRVNQALTMQQRECNLWILQNEFLIPQIKSTCLCNGKECQVKLILKNYQVTMHVITS